MLLPALSDEERLKRGIEALRTTLRDKPQLNRLLGGKVESTDDDLAQCLAAGLADWNTTPPILGFVTLATHPAKYLLLQYAAIEAVRQSLLWHSREHMPSSDGGTSGDDHAKAGEYSAWLDRLQQEYEDKKGKFKMAQNVAEALGGQGLPSEYGSTWFPSRVTGAYW